MKPSMKKTLSIALVAALALGLFAAFPQTAKAAPPTNYWDPVSGSLQAIPGVPIQIVATMTSLTNGWYYVDDTITTTGIKIAAGQDVNIVLCTGAVWTANGSWGNAGIGVPSGTKLTIYADAQNGSGSVTATGGYCGAGIGGGDGGDGGTITINGGNVTAQGDSDDGAGIGGGGSSSMFGGGGAGTVTIRGGMVNATGGSYSAGIGGGGSNGTITGGAGTVTISGGTVTATSGSYSAGIGGGGSSFGGGAGTVTISGGTVIATGSSRGAGIGGGGSNGSSGGAGMVTISGGAVTATGGSGGAGIGGGFFNNGAVTITTSGSVVAQGGEGGAGIGSGATNLASIDTGRVFITSAVTATGGAAGSGYTEGAAIGTGGTGATGSWAASATRVTYSQNTDGLGGGQALSVYCFEGRSDQVPKDTELELASPGFTTPLAGNSINTFNNQPDGSGGINQNFNTNYNSAAPLTPTAMYAQWNSTAITGVSANPASLPFSGGSSTIKVGGVSLTLETLTVTAFDVASSTSISATRTGAGTVSLAFPANNTGAAKAYTIKVSLDGGTTWEAATATVTVAAYVPSGGSDGDSYAPPSSLRIVNNIITITQLSGTRARLGVQASGGNPPYTYQWQYIGSWIDIPGATSAEFTWEGLTPGQTYTVRCVVKDRSGATVISPEKTFIAGEGLSAFPIKGEITSKNVNVRPEPNTKGKRLGRLQTGGEVSILGYTAPKGYPYGFYKIAWDNAAGYAYISADYVSVTFSSPLSASILGRVYMQSRMNTAKKYRVATLSNGDTAKLLGRYKTWWLVEYNGEKAYLKNGKYMQP